MTNALQAVLDRAAAQQPVAEPAPARERSSAATPSRKAAPPRSRARASRSGEEGEVVKHYRPVRDGKRFVGAHFHPEVARQLKVLAAEDGTTIQELLEQAVDLLFVKNGRTKIAELVRKG